MPLNTIVVNQGDLQTNVPEGNSSSSSSVVQEIILPPSSANCLSDSGALILSPWTEEETGDKPRHSKIDISSSEEERFSHLPCRPLSQRRPSTPSADLSTSTSTSTCANLLDLGISSKSHTQVPHLPFPPSSCPVMEEEQQMSVEEGSQGCDLGGVGYVPIASNKGWGILPGLGLRGGGLNSLNNGTSGWGAPPTNPNAAATGWGAPPGPGQGPGQGQGQPGAGGGVGPPPGVLGILPPHNPAVNQLQQGQGGQGVGGMPCSASSSSSPPGNLLSSGNNNHQSGSNQWASNSPNRNTSQNTNGQQNISGSQMNNNPNGGGVPPPGGGSSMQLNNQNMVPNSQVGGGGGVGGGGIPGGNLGSNPSSSGGIIPSGSSWAQAAGSNSSSSSSSGGVGAAVTSGTGAGGAGPAGAAPPSSVTSKQIEQLNSMREALFSHDGWGGNVNQDSTWDIPGSPEPTHKDLGGGQMSAPAGTAAWKVNVNNGTDLWEANLRNGGAPTVAPVVQKAPWGHTPSNNIGGTWGEEDDGGADSSSVWSGPSGGGGPGQGQGQGSGGSGGSGGGGGGGWMNNGPQQQQPGPRGDPGGNGMWNSALMKKEPNEWGVGGGGRPDGSRGHGGLGGPMGVGGGGGLGMGPDGLRGLGGGGMGGVGMGGGHSENSHSHSGVGVGRGGWGGDDPIRGRNNPLDGGNPGMWNKPGGGVPPQVQQQQQLPLQQQGVGGGWGGPGGHSGLGGMGVGGLGGMGKDKGPGSSGWDDVSPPTQRRPVPNIPNYDDGTAVWGGGGGGGPGGQGGGLGGPVGGGGHPGNLRGGGGMPPPGRGGMPNKMVDDSPVGWGGNRSNGWSGPDGPGGDGGGGFNGGRGGGGGGGWEDKSIGSWGDPGQQQMQQQQGGNSSSWGKPKTPTNNPGQGQGGSGWGDDGGIVDTSNWGAPPKNSVTSILQQQQNNSSSSNNSASSRYCNGGTPGSNVSNLLTQNNSGNGGGGGSGGGSGNINKDAVFWAATAVNNYNQTHNSLNLSHLRAFNASNNANSNNTGNNKDSFGGGGYNKKEDMELALRASHMNLSDAIDSLDGGRGGLGPGGMDPPLWGGSGMGPGQGQGQLGGPGGQGGGQRHGGRPGGPPMDHDFDLPGLGGPMGHLPPQARGGGGYGGGGLPPKQPYGSGSSLMNNVGGGGLGNNPSLGGGGGGGTGGINPSLLQRILNQQGPNSPQAIQMAVQAGYLSNQILQHPLPPQSLVLLNSLLQHIKSFQILLQAQQQMGNSNSPAALQLSVQITKTKQNIQNLHNQIAAQQAHHAKQQHHQHHGGSGPNNDFLKAPPLGGDGRGGGGGGGPGGNLMDPLGSFGGSDFLLNNKDGSGQGQNQGGQGQGQGDGRGHPGQQQQQQQQQQSRLSQWTKIPSMEKDDGPGGGSDFSRAPGPQSNNGGGGGGKNSSLMLGPSDNTWSTSVGSRSGSDGWPTDHGNSGSGGGGGGNNENDAMKGGNNSADGWQTDLVPEFEPGKPWKGTQILKTVDDDPTLTPGSVVRSPLSLATAAAAEIFAKNSNSVVSSLASDSLPLSLSSSSTWSYTPTSGGSTSIANSLAKLNSTRDLWDYGAGGGGGGNGGGGQQQQQQQQQQGSRPPPGLPPNKKQGAPVPSSGAGWLLLRNLTPQIDGSTLRTLCMQHGPLQKFHLNLSHGIALVKYNGREEAAKVLLLQAQHALNNCVLGNTTILAELASENDVQGLLHSLNAAQQSNSGFSSTSGSQQGVQGRGGGGGGGGDDNPWGLRDNSPLWSNNPWGSTGLDAGGGGGGGPDRATPSSLNSLLPDGLLGGESA